MAHIKDGVRKGIEKIVGNHDPYNLYTLACLRYGKQQHTCNRNERRGKQKPRSRLSLLCPGAVNDITHHDIGDSINDLGHNRKYGEEYTSPDVRQIQNVGIVNVQIGSEHGVEKQCSSRADQVSEPFLPCLYAIAFHS